MSDEWTYLIAGICTTVLTVNLSYSAWLARCKRRPKLTLFRASTALYFARVSASFYGLAMGVNVYDWTSRPVIVLASVALLALSSIESVPEWRDTPPAGMEE